MILAKATLVAGPRHEKYPPGTSLPALFFVRTFDEDEAEDIASRELTDLGWTTMTIERYKDVTDHEQFQNNDSAEAVAFRDAMEKGFGVVVFPQPGMV